MSLCQPGVATPIVCQGKGPSLSILVDQPPGDPGGWTIEIYAVFPDRVSSEVYIDTLTLGAPGPARPLARIAAIMTIPAAVKFHGVVTSPAGVTQGIDVLFLCDVITGLPLTAFHQ